MTRKGLKSALLISFAIIAVLLARLAVLKGYADEAVIRGWIGGYGAWAPLVYIAVYSVAPSLMMPGLALTIAGAVLFGPVWGSVYVSIGATIGACVAFLAARRMGRQWVSARLKGKRLKDLDSEVARMGWKAVAVARLIPLFPYNLLNFAFGLTGIKFGHYAVATFIFMLPGVIAYVVFSSSILGLLKGKISWQMALGAALILIISAFASVYKRFKFRRGKGDAGHG
ncbi:TVP38/TMEM64 family protein [bacterium]|nr:MAG: TVP38/TMEM64 family protein [bacterium]